MKYSLFLEKTMTKVYKWDRMKVAGVISGWIDFPYKGYSKAEYRFVGNRIEIKLIISDIFPIRQRTSLKHSDYCVLGLKPIEGADHPPITYTNSRATYDDILYVYFRNINVSYFVR